jgi:NADPH:quinone reductase-like Zn-dependent oxidoreductase
MTAGPVPAASMRAAVYGRPGAGTELRVETVPRRSPAAGEVRAARPRRRHPDRPQDPYRRHPQPIDGFQIACHDGAGRIDAVGEGVDRRTLTV